MAFPGCKASLGTPSWDIDVAPGLSGLICCPFPCAPCPACPAWGVFYTQPFFQALLFSKFPKEEARLSSVGCKAIRERRGTSGFQLQLGSYMIPPLWDSVFPSVQRGRGVFPGYPILAMNNWPRLLAQGKEVTLQFPKQVSILSCLSQGADLGKL